ncbi:MAG: type 4a pilus biogenesis protein PilO [Acidobacteria bacterium]|nr:type 4a pilus biogenesis protein PilO [Acidobacteriota bacterium]MBV9477791.1 type 4a pilus biogenesis protein PilO [Acidobacteriota bacterium]
MALTLDDKPWWVGLLVGLVLAVLCVVAVEYLFVGDVKAEIADTDREIGQLEEKIQQGRAAERKLPQFREEVKRLEQELEKLRRILPSQRNTEEIIKKVKSLVDSGEFALRHLNFPPLNTGSSDPYVEWPISIALDARYHDLAQLFAKLGNFTRIMNVEQIHMNALPNQDVRTIGADFTAKTFVYIEPKEAPKPPGGPKPGGGGGSESGGGE